MCGVLSYSNPNSAFHVLDFYFNDCCGNVCGCSTNTGCYWFYNHRINNVVVKEHCLGKKKVAYEVNKIFQANSWQEAFKHMCKAQFCGIVNTIQYPITGSCLFAFHASLFLINSIAACITCPSACHNNEIEVISKNYLKLGITNFCSMITMPVSMALTPLEIIFPEFNIWTLETHKWTPPPHQNMI